MRGISSQERRRSPQEVWDEMKGKYPKVEALLNAQTTWGGIVRDRKLVGMRDVAAVAFEAGKIQEVVPKLREMQTHFGLEYKPPSAQDIERFPIGSDARLFRRKEAEFYGKLLAALEEAEGVK